MTDEPMLDYSAVESKPIDADWGELGFDEDGDSGFTFWEYSQCDGTHALDQAILAAEDQDVDPSDVNLEDVDELFLGQHECPGCGAELYNEGPMMNYFYPVDLDDEVEAAKKLAGTCLCVVRVAGQTGLALTGGGMDLSWEIVEAFVTLGFYPPVHFARSLPRMSGRGTSESDKRLLRACLKSLRAQENWNESAAEGILRYLEGEES